MTAAERAAMAVLEVLETGGPYAMPTKHLHREEGDRLADHRGVRDERSLLVRVGALPAPVLPTGSAVPR
jgi:hypothetical protein